jgi:hypothetical protein
MSGAAGIAAAKNRRTKPDPNQKPIISCSSKSGSSCPLPPGSKAPASKSLATPFDEESLQIKGPMHLMQVLQVHEQRLNKIDDKLTRQTTLLPQVSTPPQACIQEGQACDAECYDRISSLEEKVQMLEEVIMNLQLTLTNVQSFAMESSIAMMKLQNQVTAVPATPVSATPVSATPVSATPVSATPVSVTPSPSFSVALPIEEPVDHIVLSVDETN